MVDPKEIFGWRKNSWGDNYDFEEYPSYGGIIQALCDEILLREDSGGYSGDTAVLVRKDGKYGRYYFGWGSCSGCDALEAAIFDPDEMQELVDNIEQGITWGSLDEQLAYFEELAANPSQEFSWYSFVDVDFVPQAVAILKELKKEEGEN